MDLHFTDREREFRAEARAWLEANLPSTPMPSGDTAEGFAACLEWERALAAGRWSAVSWPEEYGGRGASLIEWLIFEEEYYRCGAPPRITQNGIFLLAPALFEYGTPWQRQRYLKPMAAAEELWGQGWSEPGAGSDLASLTSSAVRVDGGWRLSGQKTWCTRAAWCDKMYGLFRTDPEADRPYRGLTYFLVDLNAPGVTVRAVERLDGDAGFAEVFLDGVFVPDEDVLGEVNRGWYVAMTTTSSERGLTLRSPGRFLATATRLVDLYRRARDSADATLRDRVAKAWIDCQAYRLYTYQTVAKMAAGEAIGASSSLNKLFWSEWDVHTHATALDLCGVDAELEEGPQAIDDGRWGKGWQFSLAGPIYAGTNEIQRNIVAERLLGLPRK